MSKTSYAVILCRFNDVDTPNRPTSYFTNAFASGKGGLRDYWYDISYNQIDLSESKLFGWWTMNYSFVNDSADPFKNPKKKGRDAWIQEAKRLAGVNGVDLSPFYGVIAVINANADDSASGQDLAVGIGGTWGEQGWKWCNKCQVLFHPEGSKLGACPNGGDHDFSGSSAYSIARDQPSFPGQSNWRLCNKCLALNYAGNPAGPCPATGVHDYKGSGNYSLGSGKVGYGGQNGWKWCQKCQGLVDAGSGKKGACAGGGVHDTSASSDYTLVNSSSNWNDTFLAHESGHTLGLQHSWYSPAPLLFAPEAEYGNPWDIMSAMTVDSFNDSPYPPAGPGADAPNLDFLGWLSSKKVSSDVGTIKLQALNDSGATLLAAKVTRAESIYYAEYRRPTAWDRQIPRDAVFINEVRPWQCCQKCQALTTNLGGPSLGPCPAGGEHNHASSGYYAPLHHTDLDGSGKPYVSAESSWKWCKKCQCMVFTLSSMGVCQAGGAHDAEGSNDYTLVYDPKYSGSGQSNWHRCTKCHVLAFAGVSNGRCAKGGTHALDLSLDYTLRTDRHSFMEADLSGNGDCWQPGKVFVDYVRGFGIVIHSFDNTTHSATISVSNLQNAWWCCQKCQGMFFSLPNFGVCPAGGPHEGDLGGELLLLDGLPGDAGQNGWRMCSKCQGLAYSGSSNGVCPATKDGHDLSWDHDYVLLYDSVMVDTQSNWRWCTKCQGLAFAGVSSGVCPAQKGGHDLTSIHDYNIIKWRTPGAMR